MIRPIPIMPVHIGTASLWATVAAHFIVFGIFLLAVWILCKKAVKENEPTPHLPFCLSMAVGLILLLVFVFGASTFTSTYVAYPQMKKFMIDPFYNDEPEEEEDEGEPIDDVPVPPAGKFGKAGGYGEDDGDLYDAGEYVTDEDEFKSRKKKQEITKEHPQVFFFYLSYLLRISFVSSTGSTIVPSL